MKDLKVFDKGLVESKRFNRSNVRIKYEINSEYRGGIVFDFRLFQFCIRKL